MGREFSHSSPVSLSLGIRAVLTLIGFTATVAQIVLLRELMVVAYGNEISLGVMLASWLLWTAFGSGVLGRIGQRWKAANVMASLLACLALLLPATILLIRFSRGAFHALPGELLGPAPIFLTCLLTLSCFCAASGWAFVAGSRLYAERAGSTATVAVSSVYLFEALGAALGGVLASVIFLRYCSALQIAVVLSAMNLIAAAALRLGRRMERRVVLVILILVSVPAIFFARIIDVGTLEFVWPGFYVIGARNSVYGNLVVLENTGTRALVENGVVAFSAPDPATAEEAVHYALLEHPNPRRLLLIGGGAGGALREALKHTTLERVDYVELDPAVLAIARDHFSEQWLAASSDARVRVHSTDGRLFLKTTSETFDVIVVNLPPPQSAQVNRFYTVEFFREAATKLAPDGVFSFRLHAAEEYLSPDLGAFLRCINASLRQAFPVVQFLPGDTVHFFAAKREGVLAASADEVLARLRARNLDTKYVREYFIPYRMAPDRMADLQQNLEPQSTTPINHDLAPIAYYFDVALWSTQFDRKYQYIFGAIAKLRFRWLMTGGAALLLVVASIITTRRRASLRIRGSAAFCVGLSGLTMITLEVLLLLGFQAVYGYVYHQLAVLIGFFMSGMALGSGWRRLRGTSSQDLLLSLSTLQVVGAISPLLLFFFLHVLVGVSSLWLLTVASWLVFPALAAAAGAIGGYQFALATEAYFSNAEDEGSLGTLYGVDLAGACLGALLLSAFLLPIFGFFKAAVFTGAANLIPALLALYAARPVGAPRVQHS